MSKVKIFFLESLFLFVVIFTLFVIAPGITHAASRYWVGGGSTANWNATAPTNWGSASNTQDNASVPGASDDVFFDGVGTGDSASTISASISINSLNMTGYANTLTHNASVTLTIAGNTFLLSSGMTYTKGNAATSALSFTSTTGTEGTPTAITTNTKIVGNLTMNGTGGWFALQDSLSSTGTLTLTDGTFAGGSGTIDIDDASIVVTAGIFNAPTGGMTVERSLSINGGTFNNTTVTFDDSNGSDDTTVTCTGELGGTVVITKDSDGDFIVAADCSINLGADPITTFDAGAVNDFVNNGTVVIPSGTWTVAAANVGSTRGVMTNAGTITHSGNGWTMADINLTNTGTITYAGTAITMDSSFTQNGTFDLTGKTITFNDNNTLADDSTVTCTGSLGGTVVITKDNDGDFIVAADCSISLGADPTTSIDNGATNDFVNNGTIVIPSGTWTVNGTTGVAILNNAGTIDHNGNGWDMDTVGLTNTGTVTYDGTALTIEGGLTQNGTFDLSGKTITFDDSSSVDDTTITCTGSLGGTVVITKDNIGDFIVASGCSINLGADPTTTISNGATNDFLNNGTVVIASGTWTISSTDGGIFTNSGTVTHSGSGLILNDANITNTTTFDLSAINVSFTGSLLLPFAPSSTIASITVNKTGSGGVELGENLTISGDLTITNGLFSTAGFDLTVSGTVSNDGVFALKGDESIFSLTPDTNSGSVFYTGTGTITGLLAGNTYNNLGFTDGLVGRWKFDEGSGSTVTDVSGYGRSGTLTNMDSSDWVAGQSGAALDFDGVDDYVSIDNVEGIALPVTVSAWVYVHSLSTSDFPIFNNNQRLVQTAHNYSGFRMRLNTAGQLSLLYGSNVSCASSGRRDKTGTTALSLNQWYHVTGVIRGAADMDLYINGIDDGGTYSGSGGDMVNVAGRGGAIGFYGRCDGPGFADFYADGLIDEVRVYDRSLSSTEVGELYAGTAPSETTYTLDANLDVGGDLTISGGTLDVSSSNHSVNVAGDWSNYGGFEARAGTVTLDGSSQSILGATSFYNLTKTVSSSDTLTFEAGETQTIENALTLTGTAGNLLSLRSSTPGTQWNIDPQGTRTLSYLDVQDSNNVNSTAISANPTMANSGNNSNWGFPTSTSSGSRRTQPVTIPPPPFIPLPTTLLPIPGCLGTAGYSAVSGASCAGNIINVPITIVTTYNLGPTTLGNGSRGEFVKNLQRFLNQALNLALVVDGILGPKTTAVIKIWQSAHGLVADGLVGPLTKAKMNAVD